MINLKGNLDIQAKWTGSAKEERRNAVKKKIKSAYDHQAEVEVIPAISDLEEGKPKTLRVAAYCRVSTDEDAQAGSYELQVQYYTELIKRNPDWIFVNVSLNK